MNSTPKLPPRLALAAQFSGNGRRIADIGTDHALLPAYLLCEGRFERALLCDIVPGPLERAKKCVQRYGLSARCEFRLTAGFDGLRSDEFDTAAICGMGGLNILGILQNAASILNIDHRLVLQPQTDILSVRAFLADFGYILEQERAVCEQQRCYTVLSVRRSEDPVSPGLSWSAEFSERFAEDRAIYLGGLHPRQYSDDAAYVRHCLRLYRPMAQGAQLAGNTVLHMMVCKMIRNLEREL